MTVMNTIMFKRKAPFSKLVSLVADIRLMIKPDIVGIKYLLFYQCFFGAPFYFYCHKKANKMHTVVSIFFCLLQKKVPNLVTIVCK